MANIAMLSGWHVHARGYAAEINRLPGAKVTAVWDEDPARGKAWADELGAAFYEDLDALLADGSIDGVACCTPTNMHEEVLIKAAKAGKHIFTEKCLALTVESANKIAAAVEEAGVKFVISYPYRTNPTFLFAKKAVDEGLLGRITLMRARNAHDGTSGNWLPPHFYDKEQCGGGAMIDLGAHPMYMTAWLMGRPATVSSAFTSMYGKGVEDNAVALFTFPDGAIAIAETGFVSANSPFTLELYGEKGALRVNCLDNSVTYYQSEGQHGWIKPVLGKPLPSALSQFVSAINDGTEPVFGMKDAVALTELMEKAYQAANTNTVVSF